jgi:hypothetical protein
MTGAGMGAGDKGVEPLDLVDKAMVHEEIERAVGHGRLRAEPGLAQPVKHLIGAHRTVIPQKDFERMPGARA